MDIEVDIPEVPPPPPNKAGRAALLATACMLVGIVGAIMRPRLLLSPETLPLFAWAESLLEVIFMMAGLFAALALWERVVGFGAYQSSRGAALALAWAGVALTVLHLAFLGVVQALAYRESPNVDPYSPRWAVVIFVQVYVSPLLMAFLVFGMVMFGLGMWTRWTRDPPVDDQDGIETFDPIDQSDMNRAASSPHL